MRIQTGQAGLEYVQGKQTAGAYGKTVLERTAAQTVSENEKAAGDAVKSSGSDREAVLDRAEFSKDTDIFKMGEEDRAALVKSLKEDLDNQMTRFVNMMTQVFQKQGITAASAADSSFWKMMSSGDYAVDTDTRAQAQAAISEDGFWGVSRTSQRIFDFAQAVAGDDTEKMKEMQKAVEKGFRQAESAWGGSLPGICGETQQAIGNLFDEYYKAHQE